MKKLAVLSAVAIAAAVAVAACSGGGDQATGTAGPACAGDQDCSGAGEVCVDGACAEDGDFSAGIDEASGEDLGAIVGLGSGDESEPAGIGEVIDNFCGVDAFQNGPKVKAVHGSSAYGYKYQCTELAYRFVCQHYMLCDKKVGVYGNAKSWYDNHSDPVLKQLDRYPNGGSEPPRAGDMIVWGYGTYGHVAIVKSVSGNVVQVLEQNYFKGAHLYTLATGGGGYSIKSALGWMRVPGSVPACSDINSADHASEASLSAPASGSAAVGPVQVSGMAADVDGLSKVTVTFGAAKAVTVRDGNCAGASQSIQATVDPASLGFAPGSSIEVAVWVKDALGNVKGPLAVRTITWQPAGGSTFCGDGACNGVETQSTCCTDCGCPGGQACNGGACGAVNNCGNGSCAGGETCGSCPADCGCPSGQMCTGSSCVPSISCGDGTCNGGETCGSCPSDCGCPSGQMCNGSSCVAAISCGDGTCNGGESQSSCCQDCGCSNGESCGGNGCACPAGLYGQFQVLSAKWPGFGASGCSGDNTTMLKASAEMHDATTLRVHVRKSDDTPFGSAATLTLYVGVGPTCPDPANAVKKVQAVSVNVVDQIIDITVNPYGASWSLGEVKQFWVGKSEGGHTAWRATGVVDVQRNCL
ncbi:MAG: CHAP domain-containing protein [Byssovorax sp.]